MSKVSDLIKGRPLYSISPEETVLEATTFMKEKNIGAVVVLRDEELIGIFSERDVMNRVVADGRNPAMTGVMEVMTTKPRTVPPSESVDNCMFLMREFGFRHLPVVEGKFVHGLVSLRDILLDELAEKDAEVKQMRAYIGESA